MYTVNANVYRYILVCMLERVQVPARAPVETTNAAGRHRRAFRAGQIFELGRMQRCRGSRSPMKIIASTVCPLTPFHHNSCPFVTHSRQAHFQLYTEPLSQCLASVMSSAHRKFTHKTARFPIIEHHRSSRMHRIECHPNVRGREGICMRSPTTSSFIHSS